MAIRGEKTDETGTLKVIPIKHQLVVLELVLIIRMMRVIERKEGWGKEKRGGRGGGVHLPRAGSRCYRISWPDLVFLAIDAYVALTNRLTAKITTFLYVYHKQTLDLNIASTMKACVKRKLLLIIMTLKHLRGCLNSNILDIF